jgi:hypothetical protein
MSYASFFLLLSKIGEKKVSIEIFCQINIIEKEISHKTQELWL